MSNNNRSNNQSSDGQYPLSLLVNVAAEGRDAGRQRPAGDGRFNDQSFNLRGLGGTGGMNGAGGFSGGDASLEEQLLLQQQAYGNGGSGGILNQLREQNLISQLSQQQQLAALLGLGVGGVGGGGGSSGGGGGHWNAASPELRQALVAAQLRQSQAASQLTQADFLALSRSGAFPSLLQGVGGEGSGLGSYGGSSSGLGSYGGSGSTSFGAAGRGGLNSADALAVELEGLQRLEELNHRKRLLAASAEAPRPTVDRGVSVSKSTMREPQVTDSSPARNEPNRKNKIDPIVRQEKLKEELSKLPGSVIVPCRARGMPMDHNFKTAYFVIPENVKHGEELICSYFACRNAGIKFRYCSHCKVPVAKRNFRKRHKHGGEIIGDKGDDSGDDETPKKGIPSQIMASRDEEEDEDGISSQSADSTNLVVDLKKSVAVQEATIVQEATDVQEANVVQKASVVEKTSIVREAAIIQEAKNFQKPLIMTEEKEIDHDGVPQANGRVDDERLSHWISLLTKRPSTKDSGTMSAWLMEVLAVSDLETPLSVPALDIIEHHNGMNGKKQEGILNDSDGVEKFDCSDNDKAVDNIAATAGDMDGSILKKKRPAELLETIERGIISKDEGNGATTAPEVSSTFASGSFAEWKERKKQKMQAKGFIAPGN